MMRAERGFLPCSRCGEDVVNDYANIMVNESAYLKSRLWLDLRIICKPCTEQLDRRAGGHANWHSIWELHSVREQPLLYLGHVLRAVARPEAARIRWTDEAVDAFIDVLIELLPYNDAQGLLQSYFADTEWNREGPRTEQFRKSRGLEDDDAINPGRPVTP